MRKLTREHLVNSWQGNHGCTVNCDEAMLGVGGSDRVWSGRLYIEIRKECVMGADIQRYRAKHVFCEMEKIQECWLILPKGLKYKLRVRTQLQKAGN